MQKTLMRRILLAATTSAVWASSAVAGQALDSTDVPQGARQLWRTFADALVEGDVPKLQALSTAVADTTPERIQELWMQLRAAGGPIVDRGDVSSAEEGDDGCLQLTGRLLFERYETDLLLLLCPKDRDWEVHVFGVIPLSFESYARQWLSQSLDLGSTDIATISCEPLVTSSGMEMLTALFESRGCRVELEASSCRFDLTLGVLRESADRVEGCGELTAALTTLGDEPNHSFPSPEEQIRIVAEQFFECLADANDTCEDMIMGGDEETLDNVRNWLSDLGMVREVRWDTWQIANELYTVNVLFAKGETTLEIVPLRVNDRDDADPGHQAATNALVAATSSSPSRPARIHRCTPLSIRASAR